MAGLKDFLSAKLGVVEVLFANMFMCGAWDVRGRALFCFLDKLDGFF